MTKIREQLADILEEVKLNKLKFEELRGLVWLWVYWRANKRYKWRAQRPKCLGKKRSINWTK